MTEKNAENADKFVCQKCDFLCHKKSEWIRHISTRKHQGSQISVTLSDNFVTKNAKNSTSLGKYTCQKCNKIYKSRNGLWVHKSKCSEQCATHLATHSDFQADIMSKIESEIEAKIKNNLLEKENLIEYLIKENQEFKGLIMELIKKDHSTNITNNNCNNVNNSFNLNLFLNETCKDAINITDFVDNIKMQLTDLENFGYLGYVEGVSRILIKNLKDLDIVKRPIHCSDLKREVLYVKNEDKWTKEDDTTPIFKSAIKQVANKNIRQIPVWREEHPSCLDPQSKQNDVYLKIVSNSMSGGSKEEMDKNYDKIVKNIAKEVTIDKK